MYIVVRFRLELDFWIVIMMGDAQRSFLAGVMHDRFVDTATYITW